MQGGDTQKVSPNLELGWFQKEATRVLYEKRYPEKGI
jgi:hypothetical protein